MESNTSSSTDTTEVRPQAGPLPQKRGEIGFREGAYVEAERQTDESDAPLPARHPADRGNTPPPPPGDPGSSSLGPPNDSAQPRTRPSSSASGLSMHKSLASGSFLLRSRVFMRQKKVGGVMLSTLFRLSIQILLICTTIVGWVLLALKVSKQSSKTDTHSAQPQDASQQDSSTSNSTAIFIHCTFAFAIIAQIVFFERCIFYIRAQRYAHVHQGQDLPRHGLNHSNDSLSGNGNTAMAFAPWNRPPLPTYAAALAQSGHGTGDVEDHLIAIPPPPAYGNTRGSTLLLSNLIRSSLRRSEAPSRTSSRMSHRDDERPRSRQMDGEWELVDKEEARRALKLAEALEMLESGSGSGSDGTTTGSSHR